METNKGTCSPMETVPRWEVGRGHCFRDCSQHLKVCPEMETEKSVFGHSLGCWIKLYLKSYLVFQRKDLFFFVCLVQFVL